MPAKAGIQSLLRVHKCWVPAGACARASEAGPECGDERFVGAVANFKTPSFAARILGGAGYAVVSPDLPPFRLGGETDPNAWHFSRLGDVGPLPNPVGHTFPLLTHDPEGRWRLVGSGFYVNDSRFFVTACHVIEELSKKANRLHRW
jgi:hypothetical protein